MRTRNCRIQVRLNRQEYELFRKAVKRTGLTQEVYLRHLINGNIPREAPPAEYFSFMRELHNVGNNLNQIAQKAHVLNVIDVKRYDEACRRLERVIGDITEAVIMPMKTQGRV